MESAVGSAAPVIAVAAPQPERLPEIEEVVAAWSIARGWVDRFAVPREHDAGSAVAVRGAGAVSVVLRAQGATVGRATIAPADGLAVRRAVGRAMSETLGTLRSAIEVEGDAAGRRLTLEMEIAGEPVPLLGRTIAEAARRVRPGLDGLAMRRGERWAFAFPGRLLATNVAENPAATIASLAAELDLPARDLPELRELDAVDLYRFETIRLVQMHPGDQPTTLYRGDELLPQGAVTRAATERAAIAIAERLLRSVQRAPLPADRAPERPRVDPPESGDRVASPAPGPLWFPGTYRPLADDHRPPVAPPLDQVLCAGALLHAAASPAINRAPGGPALAAAARETALRVIETVALDPPALLLGEEEDLLLDPRVAAATALAVLAIAPADRAPWVAQLLKWSLERIGAIDTSAPVDAAARAARGAERSALGAALVAAATARAALEEGLGVAPARVATAIEAAWASVPASDRASMLPWIVWAERDLHGLGMKGHPEVLIELREQLLAFQVGYGEAVDGGAAMLNPRPGADSSAALGAASRTPPDLIGAFVLSGAATPFAPPEVSAQSLRPLAGLAAMLIDERVTPEAARAPLWRRQHAGLRFAMQLVVRAPVDGLSRNPAAVRDGVRQAPWNSEQAPAAQAMAIIALVDSLAAWPAER